MRDEDTANKINKRVI